MLLNRYQEETPECGIDEAGRGCLAGPVTAAAVILPDDIEPGIINDSKQLTAEQRKDMTALIKEKAISYGIAHVSPEKIDEMNILQASILAMHLALGKLEQQPAFISVDGNKFNTYRDVPHACLIKGDGKYLNIAAASILARNPGMTTCFRFMMNIQRITGERIKDILRRNTSKLSSYTVRTSIIGKVFNSKGN